MGLAHFFPGWLGTMILPVSASCVAWNDQHTPAYLSLWHRLLFDCQMVSLTLTFHLAMHYFPEFSCSSLDFSKMIILIFVWHFISLHFFIVIGLFFSSFAMFP
jgi:hypothetical protein